MSEKNKSTEPVLPFESLFEDLYRWLVIRPIFAWQDWRCHRAKAYLLAHDEEYRSNHIGNEIVRRRNILYDSGMSPEDPNLPDRTSINEELPPMAWPR